MSIYADTNFFTALYCAGPHGAEAIRLHAAIDSTQFKGYPVTFLTRLEFVNALQQSVYSTRNGVPGIQLTMEMALAIEALFMQDLVEESQLCHRQINQERLEAQFQQLSHRHTARDGFRTYDILHVSSALVLGCHTFWSFDNKAKKLATLEGLTVNEPTTQTAP
jgi:predicted nucleic acid-binding protein